MNRQYVHLSSDEVTAKIVGGRRKGEVIILIVKAHEAYIDNIKFYQEQNGIWLSDPIPLKHITI